MYLYLYRDPFLSLAHTYTPASASACCSSRPSYMFRWKERSIDLLLLLPPRLSLTITSLILILVTKTKKKKTFLASCLSGHFRWCCMLYLTICIGYMYLLYSLYVLCCVCGYLMVGVRSTVHFLGTFQSVTSRKWIQKKKNKQHCNAMHGLSGTLCYHRNCELQSNETRRSEHKLGYDIYICISSNDHRNYHHHYHFSSSLSFQNSSFTS